MRGRNRRLPGRTLTNGQGGCWPPPKRRKSAKKESPVSRAHERTSLIATTNPPFEPWTEVPGSERLTGALPDRHRVRLEANGQSHRPTGAKRRLKQKQTSRTYDHGRGRTKDSTLPLLLLARCAAPQGKPGRTKDRWRILSLVGLSKVCWHHKPGFFPASHRMIASRFIIVLAEWHITKQSH